MGNPWDEDPDGSDQARGQLIAVLIISTVVMVLSMIGSGFSGAVAGMPAYLAAGLGGAVGFLTTFAVLSLFIKANNSQ